MIKLINYTGGQLVCTLANGETLRVNNKESASIDESAVNDYLRTLEKRGLVKMSKATGRRKSSSAKTKTEKEE